MEERRYGKQLVGSLLIAAAIVAVVIIAVTAKLGPTSVAEEEAREDVIKEQVEAREEAAEARQEAAEGD
jgi:hypothetical protein